MDSIQPAPQQNPRRRKPNKKKIFMEAYFPVIAAVGILVLVLIFIIVGCNARQDSRDEEDSKLSQKEEADLRKQADDLLVQAQALADAYDYEGALKLLNGFGRKIDDFPDLVTLRDELEEAEKNLVEYGPEDVVSLSFHVLIAEPERAFKDKQYGASYKRNFITTEEFSKLLQQLYDGGYVLVDIEDIFLSGDDGFSAGTVRLPQGKKPLMLTQSQVNYYTYMVDPDMDGTPDKNGAGFASRLILQDGQFKNELVNSEGQTVVGNYDMVPILEEFLAAHPDFSYRGARAMLAVTGYDGIFGYRKKSLEEVKPILQELEKRGYKVGFYSYANTDYSYISAEKVQEDVTSWENSIVPVLGSKTPYMIFPRGIDIQAPGTYSGDKFTVLQNSGFRYYIGYSQDGEAWATVEHDYVRLGRIMVTAENLKDHAAWFAGIFNPTTVLTADRS